MKVPVLVGVSVALAAFLSLLCSTNSCGAPGDLFVAENGKVLGNSIFKYTPDGASSTFAGGFFTPTGLAFDRSSNLYVADLGTGTISKITPTGEQSAFATGLNLTGGLAFDSAGNLFAAGSESILKFSSDGTKSTFASGLKSPNGLAFDTLGNLYVSDTIDGTVVRFSPAGTKTTFASALTDPAGIAFQEVGLGFIYEADHLSGTIFKFRVDGAKSTFASSLDSVGPLAFDSAGVLFAGTMDRILKFFPDGTNTTFGGSVFAGAFAFEPVTEKLRNISARGLVGTGDDVLIGGFIVGGSALANNAAVVRAIGPSLADAGVTNPLVDPVLELHNASGSIVATNDDWQDTQETEITATGLAPSDPNESAIFATLPMGNYTAVVRGAEGTTGTGLVEIYSLAQ